MLLAKKRAADRKYWLETKGNMAEVVAAREELRAGEEG